MEFQVGCMGDKKKSPEIEVAHAATTHIIHTQTYTNVHTLKHTYTHKINGRILKERKREREREPQKICLAKKQTWIHKYLLKMEWKYFRRKQKCSKPLPIECV